jgi:NADH dehydrogenase
MLVAVTGGFGFSGRYIGRALIQQGIETITLVNDPERYPDHEFSKVVAYNFKNPDQLVADLQGTDILINTYWIRFPYKKISFTHAIENSRTLLNAARAAGVRHIIHLSVSNPAKGVGLPYFQGKLQVEQLVMESGLSYTILRPTLIYGSGDILINNIAYLIRKYPIFVIPGDGNYFVQPIHVEDLAEIVLESIMERGQRIQDVAGKEIYSFNQIVKLITKATNRKNLIIHANPSIAYQISRIAGLLERDILLTRDEIKGLMANILVSENTRCGLINFSEWVKANRDNLGKEYHSELSRHFRRKLSL